MRWAALAVLGGDPDIPPRLCWADFPQRFLGELHEDPQGPKAWKVG